METVRRSRAVSGPAGWLRPPGAWWTAARTAIRGLYHHRSGIALEAPFASWERPRNFHPEEVAQLSNLLERFSVLLYDQEKSERGYCLRCAAYCEDACPTTAIRLGREYEYASTSLEDTILHVDELLIPQPIPESFEGGVHARARFIKDKDGIKVVADLTEHKKRRL